jgi:hypothetical protein
MAGAKKQDFLTLRECHEGEISFAHTFGVFSWQQRNVQH